MIEGCVITRTLGSNYGAYNGWNDPATSITCGTGDITANVIVRNCVIFNSSHGALLAGENWKAYNNTLIYNNYSYKGSQTGGANMVSFAQRSVRNIGVKNNTMGGQWFCNVVCLFQRWIRY